MLIKIVWGSVPNACCECLPDCSLVSCAEVGQGTAEMVADVFEKWVEEADIDGFNMACM